MRRSTALSSRSSCIPRFSTDCPAGQGRPGGSAKPPLSGSSAMARRTLGGKSPARALSTQSWRGRAQSGRVRARSGRGRARSGRVRARSGRGRPRNWSVRGLSEALPVRGRPPIWSSRTGQVSLLPVPGACPGFTRVPGRVIGRVRWFSSSFARGCRAPLGARHTRVRGWEKPGKTDTQVGQTRRRSAHDPAVGPQGPAGQGLEE